MKELKDNLPEDAWIHHLGAVDCAIKKWENRFSLLRACKCVALCPKCGGDGCTRCLDTGRVTRFMKSQLG
jgi:hypothetical protein